MRVMTSKTLTRADLAEVIYQKVGLSRSESASLVEFIIEEVLSSLERGEEVKISSFGNFMVRDKRARIGRNPKTGEEVTITPRRVLSFRPSQVMKQRVDTGQ